MAALLQVHSRCSQTSPDSAQGKGRADWKISFGIPRGNASSQTDPDLPAEAPVLLQASSSYPPWLRELQLHRPTLGVVATPFLTLTPGPSAHQAILLALLSFDLFRV